MRYIFDSPKVQKKLDFYSTSISYFTFLQN